MLVQGWANTLQIIKFLLLAKTTSTTSGHSEIWCHKPLVGHTQSTYMYIFQKLQQSTFYTQNVRQKTYIQHIRWITGEPQISENLQRLEAESDKLTPKSWTNLLQKTVALLISLKAVPISFMQNRPYNDGSPHKLSLAACPVLLITFLCNDNLETRSTMFYSCLAVIVNIELSNCDNNDKKIKDKNFEWDLIRLNKYFQSWS